MFGFFKSNKQFLSEEDNRLIVEAIQQAEMETSGEVRVFIESRCSWMDALDRAAELFFRLQMHNTDERNGVLVYLAVKDRQVAVFADEGIHKRMGQEYWYQLVTEMLHNFHDLDYAKGIAATVMKVGVALRTNFPYNKSTDRNELPDEIIFGS